MMSPTNSLHNSAATRIICPRVLLLDGNVQQFQVPATATGQEFYDLVMLKVQLVECDYFDLEYANEEGVMTWLDHEKLLYRQTAANRELAYTFSVKFYCPHPNLLEDEYTRYLFALQIRKDLYNSCLRCNENTAALLAAFIVQSEIGDFFENEYASPNYLKSLLLMKNASDEFLSKVRDYHRSLVGLAPAESDFSLLDTARKVEYYGLRMHPAKDHENMTLHLCVNHAGILVYQHNTRINTFSWAKIRKLSFKRRKFLVKLHPEEYVALFVLWLVEGYFSDTVEFYFNSRNECKQFWKNCIEHHAFFRCYSVRGPSKRSNRVLSRGSSFRYAGRTQKQLLEYMRDNSTKPPPFERSSSLGRRPLVRQLTAASQLHTMDNHVSTMSGYHSGPAGRAASPAARSSTTVTTTGGTAYSTDHLDYLLRQQFGHSSNQPRSGLQSSTATSAVNVNSSGTSRREVPVSSSSVNPRSRTTSTSSVGSHLLLNKTSGNATKPSALIRQSSSKAIETVMSYEASQHPTSPNMSGGGTTTTTNATTITSTTTPVTIISHPSTSTFTNRMELSNTAMISSPSTYGWRIPSSAVTITTAGNSSTSAVLFAYQGASMNIQQSSPLPMPLTGSEMIPIQSSNVANASFKLSGIPNVTNAVSLPGNYPETVLNDSFSRRSGVHRGSKSSFASKDVDDISPCQLTASPMSSDTKQEKPEVVNDVSTRTEPSHPMGNTKRQRIPPTSRSKDVYQNVTNQVAPSHPPLQKQPSLETKLPSSNAWPGAPESNETSTSQRQSHRSQQLSNTFPSRSNSSHSYTSSSSHSSTSISYSSSRSSSCSECCDPPLSSYYRHHRHHKTDKSERNEFCAQCGTVSADVPSGEINAQSEATRKLHPHSRSQQSLVSNASSFTQQQQQLQQQQQQQQQQLARHRTQPPPHHHRHHRREHHRHHHSSPHHRHSRHNSQHRYHTSSQYPTPQRFLHRDHVSSLHQGQRRHHHQHSQSQSQSQHRHHNHHRHQDYHDKSCSAAGGCDCDWYAVGRNRQDKRSVSHCSMRGDSEGELSRGSYSDGGSQRRSCRSVHSHFASPQGASTPDSCSCCKHMKTETVSMPGSPLVGEYSFGSRKMHKRKRNEERVAAIMKELLMTEKTYKKDLEVICIWFRKAVASGSSRARTRLPQWLSKSIYALLDPIYDHHVTMLKELESRLSSVPDDCDPVEMLPSNPIVGTSPTHVSRNSSVSAHPSKSSIVSSGNPMKQPLRVGDLFLSDVRMLPSYRNYFSHQEGLLSDLEATIHSNSNVEAGIREFETKKLCYLPLYMFFLKPMHRLLHYRIIFERLIRNYDDDHPDLPDCRTAHAQIVDVLQRFRDSYRRMENQCKLLELQRDLMGIQRLSTINSNANVGTTSVPSVPDESNYGVLAESGREFIREGWLQKVTKKGRQPRMFFLFSDQLIYASSTTQSAFLQFRVHRQFPLKDVMVEECDAAHGFTIYCGRQCFVVAAASDWQRDRWVEDISRAILAARSSQNELIPAPMPSTAAKRVDAPSSTFMQPIENDSKLSDENSKTDEVSTTDTVDLSLLPNEERTFPASEDQMSTKNVPPPSSSCSQSRQYSDRNSTKNLSLQRSNSSTYVCWHRNVTLSMSDVLRTNEFQISGYLLRKFKNSQGWQKLWIVFSNLCLFFYKTCQDDCPLASLPLLGYYVLHPEPDDHIYKDHVFKLQFKSHIYFFRVKNAPTFERWFEVLSCATSTSYRSKTHGNALMAIESGGSTSFKPANAPERYL